MYIFRIMRGHGGWQYVKTALIQSIIFLSALFCSCGYRMNHISHCEEGEKTTVSISYVEGDTNGLITEEIIKAITISGAYRYRAYDGDMELKVRVKNHRDTPIGWKYQRKVNGELKQELIATEGRLEMCADVTLIHGITKEIMSGPTVITAVIDYDYYEPDCIQDLSFILSPYGRRTSVQYSLGQLDAEEGAYDAAFVALGRELAKKIVKQLFYFQRDYSVSTRP